MPRHLRNRLFAAAGATLALTLASCSVSGSNSKGAASSTTASSTKGPDYAAKFAADPVQGITKNSITLGMAMIDYAKIKSQFGVDPSGGGDALPKQVLPALVKALNKSGGINGRKLKVDTAWFVPVGTDSTNASCRKLIEDDKVFAVVGAYLADGGLCVTETHKTPYFAGWGLNEERQARSKAPFITVQGSDESLTSAGMKSAIASGVLKDKKVAVYWDNESSDSLVNNQILAPLKAGGVNVVAKAKQPDSSDQVKAGQDLDTIFQRFQAEGADALIVQSGLSVIIPALERSSWHPQLVFTNGQTNGSLTGFGLKNPETLKGAIAVTQAIPPGVVEKDPKYLNCLDRINANSDLHLKPTDDRSPKDFKGSVGAISLPAFCQLFDLSVKVLKAAGDNPSSKTIIQGLAKLNSFSLPGIPNASLSPTNWGADNTSHPWHFNVAKSVFIRDDDTSSAN